MTKKLITVLWAADSAARWRVHQRRKGAAGEPYINHLLEVASLVAVATNAEDPDLVVAALLHDAIEDQQVPRSAIADAFGEEVAKLVEELSDDKLLPKEVRKQLQIERAPYKSREAKILKLADKISNLRSIAVSPPPDWSVGRRLDYVAWARKVVVGLKGVSPHLEEMFERVAEEAERAIRIDAPGTKFTKGS